MKTNNTFINRSMVLEIIKTIKTKNLISCQVFHYQNNSLPLLIDENKELETHPLPNKKFTSSNK